MWRTTMIESAAFTLSGQIIKSLESACMLRLQERKLILTVRFENVQMPYPSVGRLQCSRHTLKTQTPELLFALRTCSTNPDVSQNTPLNASSTAWSHDVIDMRMFKGDLIFNLIITAFTIMMHQGQAGVSSGIYSFVAVHLSLQGFQTRYVFLLVTHL